MIKRTDRFTGEVGEYCTTYNALVRIVGKEEAKIIQKSKEVYQSLNFALKKAATEHKTVYGEDVRHPNIKVPAFYGMKKEMFEKLENKKSRVVAAYKSDWLFEWIKELMINVK